jgi:anthranilate phosphoribosyltransferase
MKQQLDILASGQYLTVEQTIEAFDLIMTGQATSAQLGALLAMIQVRGPSIEELTGAARVMRQKVTPTPVPQGLRAIDLVGTGGDFGGTFNISTAAAIVAAAAARPHNIVVAKHGSRAVTSKSGSSQVLETLGVKLAVSGDTQSRCLDQAGICFCFSPAHHPAMKHVAPVRAELGMRTIFNFLGPLTNPAGARSQVLGVFAATLTEPIARVLKSLGSDHAMVVHGLLDETHGLDELITSGPSKVSHLRHGEVLTYRVEPDKLGFKQRDPKELLVDGPEQSAHVVREVLRGRPGHPYDIVCLNAAAALVVADLVVDLHEGIAQAAEAIDSGAAAATLDKLVAITQAD